MEDYSEVEIKDMIKKIFDSHGGALKLLEISYLNLIQGKLMRNERLADDDVNLITAMYHRLVGEGD